jgi:hypothetical protein
MTSTPRDPQWKMCDDMLKLMKNGLLMPFFGAGVNLANRPPGTTFVPDGPYLPNGSELSEDLLREFECSLANPCELPEQLPMGARCKWKEQSLLRVSWYVSAIKGKASLYHYLQKVFAVDRRPTDVHEFFARFPKRLSEKGYPVPQQLIVTTNYDELLERAFDAADEPYDVFSYVIDSDSELGKFSHTPHKREPVVISNPTTYVPQINHTIILKIHGTAHPQDWENSTFVITEDDYIDYAALVNFDKIPAVLANKMLHRRFLYLGYSLSDWNFRVFLRGIKARSRFNDPTWAIMQRHDEWERLYWKEHKVEIIQMSLGDHIEILNRIVDEMPSLR